MNSKPFKLDWIKEGDEFKRPSDTNIQIIDEIVEEWCGEYDPSNIEVCVHHHDKGDESGCGYCSPIQTFDINYKVSNE